MSFNVIDGAGQPIGDAMIETWQADAAGRFNSPTDPRGAAEATPPDSAAWHACSPTRAARSWCTRSSRAHFPAEDGAVEAPHINVGLFARGMLERLYTRLYFPEDTDAHASDPVLSAVPEADRPQADRGEDGSRIPPDDPRAEHRRTGNAVLRPVTVHNPERCRA